MSALQAELAPRSARRARRAARAARRARASSISSVDRDRHEVGLGEVAVVVRLLLGAQRGDRARARVEVQRLLLDLPAGLEDRRPGARSRRRMPRSMKRNEFMFFSSVLVPELRRCPTGRIEMLASQRSEPSSMFTSLTPELAQRRAQQLAATRAPARPSAQVGLGDDLDQRRAAAVEVDDARVGAVDAPATRRRARAWPRPPRGGRGGCARRRAARRGTAGSSYWGSGSPWAGRDRSSSCGGRSTAARARSRAPARSSARSGRPRALATGSAPGRPRHTGQVCVLGGSPKRQLAAAEHLRPRRELDVDLQADDGLVASARVGLTRAPASRRSRSPARARAPRRGCGSR